MLSETTTMSSKYHREFLADLDSRTRRHHSMNQESRHGGDICWTVWESWIFVRVHRMRFG